jgi:glutathione synthase/RimK-type ligase-like ATP-grasp enzyme
MSRLRIFPYNQHSKSAKALRDGLHGSKLLKRVGSRFVPRRGDEIINWGASDCPFDNYTSFNKYYWVGVAAHKLWWFRQTEEAGITPRYWEHREAIPEDAFPIVCRTVLQGHSGAGIVIANNRDELVPAPLYVEYKKKKDEFRVHVGDGGKSIISVQRKARDKAFPNPNWQVRNHANGFIYARHNFDVPPAVISAAKLALEVSNLDHGAVDVIWNDHEEKAYVLEINTAPGLEGETVNDYIRYFTERLEL